MNQLIACCGLDCEKCDARIATITNDSALREKTADSTVLIVAQRISTILHADKIVVLVDGEIRAIGSKDEIMPVLMQASSVCSRLADKV